MKTPEEITVDLSERLRVGGLRTFVDLATKHGADFREAIYARYLELSAEIGREAWQRGVSFQAAVDNRLVVMRSVPEYENYDSTLLGGFEVSL